MLIPGLVMNNAATWSEAYATSIKNMSAIFPLVGSLVMLVGNQFIYNLNSKKLAEIETALGRNGKEVDTSLETMTRKED